MITWIFAIIVSRDAKESKNVATVKLKEYNCRHHKKEQTNTIFFMISIFKEKWN